MKPPVSSPYWVPPTEYPLAGIPAVPVPVKSVHVVFAVDISTQKLSQLEPSRSHSSTVRNVEPVPAELRLNERSNAASALFEY